MSYDIFLTVDTGGAEETGVADVGNYTSNVAGMWAEALGKPLRDYDGCLAGDALADLRLAIDDMTFRPGFYRAMNPDNGWGNYEGALDYLHCLRDSCAQHPKATIRISH